MAPTPGQKGENPAYRSSWPRRLSHDRNAGQPPCWSVSVTERSAPRLSQPWNPVNDRRVSAMDHCSRSPSLGTAALTAPWSSPWTGRRSVPLSAGRVILTLLSLARAATSVIFVATNTSFVVTKICLSRHNVCRDKHVFVLTTVCHEKNILSRQTSFYCHKSFVAANIILLP